jgi:hypothetical protein
MRFKYFFFFFALSSTIYSQINIGISAGTISSNTFFNNNMDVLDLYWKTGFAINLNGEYFLSRTIAISPIVEYATYKFDKYFLWGAQIPEDYVKDATGKSSNEWNLFLSIKYFPHTNTIFQFVFVTGLGYIVENIGVINATFGNLNTGENNIDFKLKRDNKFVHLLGLSLRIKLLSNISMNINGSYYSNYTDRFYPTINAGFIYQMAKNF